MAANNFRLRILIIDRLGPDIQDSDWNPDLVAADILAALILTPTQARELSDHWQALPVERIGELRDVKSTTAPLQRLPPPPAWSNPRPGPRMARHPRTPALSNEQGRPRHAGGHRSELSPQDPSTRSEASVLDTVHNENTQVTELSILKAQDNARKRHIATDTLPAAGRRRHRRVRVGHQRRQ